MKKLLFITKDTDPNNQNFLKEISQIFSGYISIEFFCSKISDASHMKPDIKDVDIILSTNPYTLSDVRRFIGEDTKIIMLDFTFRKDLIEALQTFPPGTEALVCSKYYSDAHQMAYGLYEAGADNLNLYINYQGNQNMVGKNMDIAIISHDTSAIPDYIDTFFDLGSLHVSLSTIMDIATVADVMCDDLEIRIIRHCSSLCLPSGHASYFFNNSPIANMQLRTITNCIDYGVLILNNEFQVISCNNQFKKMHNMDIKDNLLHVDINDIPAMTQYVPILKEKAEFQNQLIESRGSKKFFLLSKEKINKNENDYNIYMVLFKDITKIHALEDSFRNQITKKGYTAKYTFDNIIHADQKTQEVIDRSKKLAKIDKTTLIVGESGTGKELFAHSIHNASSRSTFPFIALNCATIPANLLESELFGYEEGAFTGARKGGKTGLLQAANKGTIFLDEIGEIPLEIQAKLLRVLEEKEIMKVGGDEIIKIDVRVIAATNRDLKKLVAEGTFRLDLYYRLNTITINVPPLRERPDDILPLIHAFMESEGGSNIPIADDLMNFLLQYKWEGNIRELKNCIEYMSSICSHRMELPDLPEYLYDEYKKGFYKVGDADRELPLADNSEERRTIKSVLTIIRDFSPGRRKLLTHLRSESYDISEYQLRNLLSDLNSKDYIRYGKGRAGCKITMKGEEFLDSIG